jgi:hypothetical protein
MWVDHDLGHIFLNASIINRCLIPRFDGAARIFWQYGRIAEVRCVLHR